MRKTALLFTVCLLAIGLQAQSTMEINDFLNLSVGYDYNLVGDQPDYGNTVGNSGAMINLDYGIRTNKVDFLISGFIRFHPYNSFETMKEYYAENGAVLTEFDKGFAWSNGFLLGAKYRFTDADSKMQLGLYYQFGVAALTLSDMHAGFENGYANTSNGTGVGLSHQLGLEIQPFEMGNTTSAFRLGIFTESGGPTVKSLTADDSGNTVALEKFVWQSKSLYLAYVFGFDL